jgi:hypothetical protein
MQIEVANEVCRDYHNGKFDPVAHSMLPKRKKLRDKWLLDLTLITIVMDYTPILQKQPYAMFSSSIWRIISA